MNRSHLRKAKLIDRLAGGVIVAGGLTVIVSVVMILALIVSVTLPLFQPASAETQAEFGLPEGLLSDGPAALGLDDYLETGYVMDATGTLVFLDLRNGRQLGRETVPETPKGMALKAVHDNGDQTTALLWANGTAGLLQVDFVARFSGDGHGARYIDHSVHLAANFAAPKDLPVTKLVAVRHSATTDAAGCARLLADGRIHYTRREVSSDLLGKRQEKLSTALLTPPPGAEVSALLLDGACEFLYAGTTDGMLLRWRVTDPDAVELLDRQAAFADSRQITNLGLTFGDVSLLVAGAGGDWGAWFPVRVGGPTGAKRLRRIHPLRAHAADIVQTLPSRRNKTVFSLDRQGSINLDYPTSERHLLELPHVHPLRTMALNGRGQGLAALSENGTLTIYRIENPHPEVSLGTLFGAVWYEGYDRPEYSWQSSATTDDYEPKLSVVPLIFGTLKGTLYAMGFAVPLALLAALYVSQFTTHEFRNWIKPAVEVMAAIPSVVVGFLIALWLAPILEYWIVALFASLVTVPLAFSLFLLFWQAIRHQDWAKRVEKGYEFMLALPVLLLGLALAAALGPYLERVCFDGNFAQWLYSTVHQRYDQRNCLIIAFGLGFAVIPIIFSIAEDSLANVPFSLTAASLALGASRWQTVWRVILPSASPGIFAAIMIGFGRAIGETMIVLMATGNTAIMDWSPFNGMRTMSANIAVEIPEAPVGGTLYRVLFLVAVLLFLMTFALNTLAELVRHSLRKKYGQVQ